MSLRQLDPEGSGWVEVNKILEVLPVKFGVMPKTIKNNLHICENKGYGAFSLSGERFYYVDQYNLIQAMGGQFTSRSAVHIDNFDGSVVKVRARFHAALLATHGSEITMSRYTINQLSGRAKKTQRKYERLNGTLVKPNFARFREYKGNKHELDSIRYAGHAAFIDYDKKTNKHYITKQLANSYSLDFKRTRKKTRDPLIIMGRGNHQRVYFNSLKAAEKEWIKNDYVCDVYFWNDQEHVYEWQPAIGCKWVFDA